jgi:putative transposase
MFTSHEAVDPILMRVREAAAAHAFAVLAYCFMPDHLHLVVEGKTEAADLKRFVKAWKQKTGFEYSERCGNRLWQVGFFDHVLRSDESTERHVDYVLGNPVRAGLARTIDEYPFAGCFLPETDRSPET